MNSDYPRKFDTSTLTVEEKKLLVDFFRRRQIFDLYLENNKIAMVTCPGCGYPTLHESGAYEICKVCNWENDEQDNEHADEIWGDPNGNISLTENRLVITKELTEDANKAGKTLSEDPKHVYLALHQNFYPPDLF